MSALSPGGQGMRARYALGVGSPKAWKLAAVLAFWPVPALAKADPCEGALPKPGQSFSGVVHYVGDGDGLCIGPTADPSTWIEVRLADFYAVELNEPGGRRAKAALEALALGRRLDCVAGRRSYDRVVAKCRLGDQSVGELLLQRGVAEGGRGR
jgi:endonuclease YncB( thermonuclease family)